MTRLVHRVGINGEVHETPVLTTYRCGPNQEAFQVDLDDEYYGDSSSLFHLISFSCSSLVDPGPACPLLAISQPVTSTPLAIAANERVRKSPPHTTSEETTVTIKRPKTDTAGSRGRTRISDFDDLTKSLANETISIYQAQIVAGSSLALNY